MKKKKNKNKTKTKDENWQISRGATLQTQAFTRTCNTGVN